MIYGLNMGVAGAAVSTLLSRMLSAVFITVLLRNQHLTVHFPERFSLRLKAQYAKRILHIGVPSGFENSIFQLGKILILNLVASFGTSEITANAVSFTVSAFHCLPASSAGLALLTVISRCVGMGDYQQARYYTKKIMLGTYAVMIMYNGIFIFLTPLIFILHRKCDSPSQSRTSSKQQIPNRALLLRFRASGQLTDVHPASKAGIFLKLAYRQFNCAV